LAGAADSLISERARSGADRPDRAADLFLDQQPFAEDTGQADRPLGTTLPVAALILGVAAVGPTDNRAIAIGAITADRLIPAPGARAHRTAERATGTLLLSRTGRGGCGRGRRRGWRRGRRDRRPGAHGPRIRRVRGDAASHRCPAQPEQSFQQRATRGAGAKEPRELIESTVVHDASLPAQPGSGGSDGPDTRDRANQEDSGNLEQLGLS
jgi:hypothetical protein